jgi:hypothetical protein
MAIAVFGFIAVALTLWGWHDLRFAAEVRASAAAALALEICQLQNDRALDCRAFTDETANPSLTQTLGSLSQASASVAPGKVTIVNERILRLRGRAPLDRQYPKCYRLVEFEGFPGEYVREVSMDLDCVQVENTGPGAARIPRIH